MVHKTQGRKWVVGVNRLFTSTIASSNVVGFAARVCDMAEAWAKMVALTLVAFACCGQVSALQRQPPVRPTVSLPLHAPCMLLPQPYPPYSPPDVDFDFLFFKRAETSALSPSKVSLITDTTHGMGIHCVST